MIDYILDPATPARNDQPTEPPASLLRTYGPPVGLFVIFTAILFAVAVLGGQTA